MALNDQFLTGPMGRLPIKLALAVSSEDHEAVVDHGRAAADLGVFEREREEPETDPDGMKIWL